MTDHDECHKAIADLTQQLDALTLTRARIYPSGHEGSVDVYGDEVVIVLTPAQVDALEHYLKLALFEGHTDAECEAVLHPIQLIIDLKEALSDE